MKNCTPLNFSFFVVLFIYSCIQQIFIKHELYVCQAGIMLYIENIRMHKIVSVLKELTTSWGDRQVIKTLCSMVSKVIEEQRCWNITLEGPLILFWGSLGRLYRGWWVSIVYWRNFQDFQYEYERLLHQTSQARGWQLCWRVWAFSESNRGQLDDLKMGCHTIHFVFWKDNFGCSVKNWLIRRRDLRDKNTLLEAIGSRLGKRWWGPLEKEVDRIKR